MRSARSITSNATTRAPWTPSSRVWRWPKQLSSKTLRRLITSPGLMTLWATTRRRSNSPSKRQIPPERTSRTRRSGRPAQPPAKFIWRSISPTKRDKHSPKLSAPLTACYEVPGGESELEEYFENKVGPYNAMTGLSVAENNAPEALAYAERAKGRVILEALRSGRIRPDKAMTAQERQQEQELTAALVALNTQINREKMRDKPDAARLSALNARLETARLDREEFQVGLYAAHPELKTQRGEAEVLRVEQARELLRDEQSALLEYAVADEQVYLFVLTKGAASSPVVLRALTLPIKRTDLAARVEKFRQRLANRDLDYAAMAAELYNLLLKPAAEQLRNKTTLVIVPDGILWDLPFQALQPAPNHYLVEDYALSYAPSLTVLREMMAKRRKQESDARSMLLAIGNPALGQQTVERARTVLINEQLALLPEAERQVKTLGQLYGPGHSTVYIGAEAREDG